jgi:hypothetical protein
VEADEIDIPASAVLRDFQKVEHAQKAGRLRQLGCNVGEPDPLDRIDFNLTFLHRIPIAHLDMRPRPYAYTAGDFSSTNTLAKPFGELHNESLSVPVRNNAPIDVQAVGTG